MTSKKIFLKTLPLMAVLLTALTACGGGDTVDPGVQTAQADFNASAAPQPGQPGAAIPAPELQADAADVAAAAAEAANAAATAAAAAAIAMPAPVMPVPGVDATANAAANAVTPAPDCAAEGCSGLRIIDGNAEAYRADAPVRENREQARAY
jgi:hypothetical protein